MKKCEVCREVYNDDVKVCPNCGFRFPNIAPSAPQPPKSPQSPAQPAQQAQPNQSSEGQAAPQQAQQTQQTAPNTYTPTYTTQPSANAAPANAAHKLGWFKFYSIPLVIILIVGYALSLLRFVFSDNIGDMFSGYLTATGTVLTALACILNIALVVVLFIMVLTLHKFKPLGYTMNLIFLISYPIYCVINIGYTLYYSSTAFLSGYFTVVAVISMLIGFVLACVFSVLNLIYFQKRRYMFYGEAPSKYKASRIVVPLVIIGLCSLIVMVGSIIGLKSDYNVYNNFDKYYDDYYDNDYSDDYDDSYDYGDSDDSNDTGHKTVDGATATQQEALDLAYDYLDSMAFSRAGLIGQLEYEGCTTEDATFAVDNCGADWNEQAAIAAQEWLDYDSTMSRDEIIEMLIFNEYTQSEAEYGVKAIGM